MRKFAGWSGTVREFIDCNLNDLSSVLEGYLLAELALKVDASQRKAWIESFNLLHKIFRELIPSFPNIEDWRVVLEYQIPRERGRRPDVVILAPGRLFILEFKSATYVDFAHIDQVSCYARDLANYHSRSHDLEVVPILIIGGNSQPHFDSVITTGQAHLKEVLQRYSEHLGEIIDHEEWVAGDYDPLPSLVTAARLIFRNEELPRIRNAHSAGIPLAFEYLLVVADTARTNRERHLVLVSGVPGSGKTLLGLQYVYADHFSEGLASKNALLLSGNIPLIAVLQDALKSSVFVQDVHGFLTQYGTGSMRLPKEHVFVFDEAQRAWDALKVQERRPDGLSEPDEFIKLGQDIPDWSVMVGLIGEGQEIFNGEEAGLGQWDQALARSSASWTVHCPSHVAHLFQHGKVSVCDALNLTASLRSHVASDLHSWVGNVLGGQLADAAARAKSVRKAGYQLYITRDLEKAKRYVRERYETELDKRYGLLASSKLSKMLEEDGLRVPIVKFFRHGKWYNGDVADPNSSCALKVAASEFNCQGLELDMPILYWGNDLVWENDSWKSPMPRSNNKARDPHRLRLNSYRVLMTRGRDGMIVHLPDKAVLDQSEDALLSMGAVEL